MLEAAISKEIIKNETRIETLSNINEILEEINETFDDSDQNSLFGSKVIQPFLKRVTALNDQISSNAEKITADGSKKIIQGQTWERDF